MIFLRFWLVCIGSVRFPTQQFLRQREKTSEIGRLTYRFRKLHTKKHPCLKVSLKPGVLLRELKLLLAQTVPGCSDLLNGDVSKTYVRAKSVRKEVRCHICLRTPYVSASNGERLRTGLGGHGLWSRLVGSSYVNVRKVLRKVQLTSEYVRAGHGRSRRRLQGCRRR